LKLSQYNKIILRKKLLKMKAVYPYNLRLLTIFNQKNKVRLVKFKINNFQVKMVLYHFNLKISQYNKIFLRKKLLKMKAVYSYNLRLLTIFNQKNKVRLVKFKIINFQVKMVLHHFNLKISQYNKIFLRKKLLKMKAVYPYNLRLLTIFNQKNKVRLVKFKIINFQVKMVFTSAILKIIIIRKFNSKIISI